MNKVFAIMGPPGSGKTAIVKRLLEDNGIPALVSHTTRIPRPEEKSGVDYYFVGKEEFAGIHYIEKAEYAGCLYGLSKDEVLKKVGMHPVSVVDISVQGYEQLRKVLGERLESIYILVDKDTLLKRYLLQGDSLEDIKRRIEYAEEREEFNNWQIADHVVKNTSSLDVTLRQVRAILDVESLKE